jgi:FtsP/CotA-like multicopper oxidase with cupredoxin domain
MRATRVLLYALPIAALVLATPLRPWPGGAAAQGEKRQAEPALAGGKVRTHHIAAEEVDWDYAPLGRDEMMGHAFMEEARIFVETGPKSVGRVHKKATYVEYTDAMFATRKPRPTEWQHAGILGPILRAEVGDTLRIVFRNRTSRPYSMHAHGVFYRKDSEGAPSNDGKTEAEKKGDAVPPAGEHTYVWPVPERAGPGARDPSSIVWLYHSHTDRVKDTNSGLIGAMIIARKGSAGPSGRPRDVDREFITLWKIFDEGKSWYLAEDVRKRIGGNLETLQKDPEFKEGNKKHAVNGLIFGNLPLMTMRQGERVRWYLVGLGNEPDLHTPHWHGHTVLHEGRRKDVVSLLPAEHVQVDMIPDNPGIWMLHCHVDDHLDGGMSARYQVRRRAINQ